MPEAFKQYRNDLYPNYRPAAKPAVKPGAPKNGAPPKPEIKVAVGQRPAHRDVNWDKTTDIDWANGIAYLVNGNRVKFDRNAPANNPYKS